MAVSEDKCIQCGNRYRSNDLEPISPSGALDPDGSFMGLPYWFCSVDCYKKAVRKFLDPRYDFDKRPHDDEEYCNRVREAYIDYHVKANEGSFLENLLNPIGWKKPDDYCKPETDAAFDAFMTKKESEIIGAEIELQNRLSAEWDYAMKQETEARDKETAKRQDQILKLAAEEKERQALQDAYEEMLQSRDIPPEIRVEHTHILGPSGSGKTTLLQNQIIWDYVLPELDEDNYYKVNPNPPAYIVIDPKGLMVERLSKRAILADRLVIVDPFDAPALNLFQATGRNPAQLISDFGYIFSTTKQKLTGKQSPCFSFCARLLFTIPHANLLTLLDLLDDRTQKKPPNPLFLDAIPKLPPVARRFFEADFYSANYASTREEIKSRIYGVLENDTLSTMLNANTRKLDLAKCIRERKIVLINTRMKELKEAHQTFGRYMIALATDAILSRTERHPVYIVIDEFQEFADPQKTPEMLRLIREYGGGAVLAHQNMFCTELDDDTRSAISTNTSIKYASSPEAKDLRYMAQDLRCDPDWLKQQHKSKTHAKFACFVRGMHPPLQHPFVMDSKIGEIDEWPAITDQDYKGMRARNKSALQDLKEEIRPPRLFPDVSTAPEQRVQAPLLPANLIVTYERAPPQKESDPSKPSKWTRK